ncbi:GNAT family N-acetyltransferase [Kitasatospora sp. NBC_00374]|uniref:GNAT family N-acetyltransferase n=1 Tax=Kitasatospora sp. NBC_00374 TaxID=2975964 RepID=UPI0030E3C2E6
MRQLSSLGRLPTLREGRVSLRRPTGADAETLLAGSHDPLVREFAQRADPHPDQWNCGRAAHFAVLDGDGPAVGWAELVNLRPEEAAADVAVWLLPASRNLRVAISALRLICRFGFEQLELERIDAHAAAHNMGVQLAGAWIGFRRTDSAPQRPGGSHTHRLNDAAHATLVPGDLC